MPSTPSSKAIAGDAHPTWAAAIAKAQSRIVVLTPYLDELLVTLIRKATIPPEAITVVTDLSPESSATDYLRQLKALSELAEASVDLRSLARLHAKVLLADDEAFTVGSQNFTTYARKSRETTIATSVDADSASFIATLWEWIDEATPLDHELLSALISAIETEAQHAHEAALELKQAVDVFLDEWRATQAKNEEKRLTQIEIASPFQLVHGSAWAKLQLLDTETDMYWSLIGEPGTDLTAWKFLDEDGDFRPAIGRLTMCPVFRSDTQQMALGRIGKTRVTYIRRTVSWSSLWLCGDTDYSVTLRFPETGTRTCNIKFDLSTIWEPSTTITLDAHFDGSSLRFLGTRPQPGHRRDARFTQLSQGILDELSDDDSLDEFLSSYLVPFKYSDLRLGNKNAEKFFSDHWYRLSLGAMSHSPVLIATPQK